jgi:hypothetical protein
MVQMTAADQAIVKSIPGNDKCCECGMKNPQWASVSFGTVFCLDCSGVHRCVIYNICTTKQIFLRVCGEKMIGGCLLYIFDGILYSDVHQEEGESSDFHPTL